MLFDLSERLNISKSKEFSNPESNNLESPPFVNSTIQNYNVPKWVCGMLAITFWYFSYLSAPLLKYPAAKTNISFVIIVPLNFKRLGNNCSVLSGSRAEWLWYSRAPLTFPAGATQIFLVGFHDSEFRWINAASVLGTIMLILFSL